jgi:hypothetical protein
MTRHTNGSAKADGKDHRAMIEGYARFVADGRKERGPRTAHLFALAMLHRGVTYGRSVQDIILELEGELPAYWSAG